MQPPTTKKRVKRLLRLLKQQQEEDTEISAVMVTRFKYLLPYNTVCRRIRVKYPVPDPSVDFQLGANINLELSRRDVPKFISSQLEAWKITDPDSDIVQVPFALKILIKRLTADFDTDEAYPTVLLWPCSQRHRTLYFFAFLDFEMPSNQYTIQDILGLRRQAMNSKQFLRRLELNPDFQALRRELHSPPAEDATKQAASQQRDDSSTSSEEVLFKGTARRRQATSRETAKSRQIEPKGETAWKYSGRTESDPASTEPLPAPTGLPAQKREGFQRFYKAVVSPTHVRVTAGGRIVPNTRGPPSSPTMKRAQEGSVTGSNGVNDRPAANVTPIGMPLGLGMGQQIQSPMPPYYTGFGSPAFPPYGPQMPFYPMPYGPPMPGGYQYAYQYPMRQSSVESTLRDTVNLKTGDGQVDNGDEPRKTDQVQTAPASQFDQRRPYFYNGQWMYPIHSPIPPQAGAMGSPYMPMQMQMPMSPAMAPGPVPPMGPRALTSMVQPQQLGSPIKFASPVGPTQPSRSLPILATAAPAVPANGGIQGPSTPPISSIRPSEITRKQIGIFRKSLKYHEDQLQYNRHQIDEKDTEQKIQKFRDNIARFEYMMQVQIEDEKKRGYPPLSEKDKGSAGSSGSDKKLSTASEDATPAGTTVEQSTGAAAPPTREDTASNTTGQTAFPYAVSHNGQQAYEAVQKPGLPTGAALAPPFEPRKDTPGVPNTVDGINPMWHMPAYPTQAADESYGRFAAATHPWQASSSKPEPAMFASPSGRPMDANVASVTSKGSLGVPYLIGSLPKGMNPRIARDTDYQYSRELTADEIRARYLYWGKAPASVVRGLPKYDGRHFYPPSPVKDTAKDVSALESDMDLLSFSPQPIGTKPDTQPARPSTPVGSALIPRDSFEGAEHHGADQIYTVTESAKVSDKPGSAKGKSEGGVDSASVGSHDRRSEKPGGARLWEVLLKKGSSAALSSTTAEGKLQAQCAGSATASLSPTINRNTDRPASLSPGKDSVNASEGGASLTPVSERRGKNRVLNGEASHEQLAAEGSSSVPATLGA